MLSPGSPTPLCVDNHMIAFDRAPCCRQWHNEIESNHKCRTRRPYRACGGPLALERLGARIGAPPDHRHFARLNSSTLFYQKNGPMHLETPGQVQGGKRPKGLHGGGPCSVSQRHAEPALGSRIAVTVCRVGALAVRELGWPAWLPQAWVRELSPYQIARLQISPIQEMRLSNPCVK